MKIIIHKDLEEEFLKLKPMFKYCFSKDKRAGVWKEYEYKVNTNISLSQRLKNALKYQDFINKLDLKTKEQSEVY